MAREAPDEGRPRAAPPGGARCGSAAARGTAWSLSFLLHAAVLGALWGVSSLPASTRVGDSMIRVQLLHEPEAPAGDARGPAEPAAAARASLPPPPAPIASRAPSPRSAARDGRLVRSRAVPPIQPQGGAEANAALAVGAGAASSPPASAAGTGRDAGGASAGSSPAGGLGIEEYLAHVRRRLQQHLVFPPSARRLGLAGAATVRFTIRADGSVDRASVAVEESSGLRILDHAAEDTVIAAAPFPAPRAGDCMLRVPVAFALER